MRKNSENNSASFSSPLLGSFAIPNIRTGIGMDVHALGKDGTCHLACLEWADTPKLIGHSDGDVVAHAICDALLSACGIGDLGSNFGVDQPQWKGAAGQDFLAETLLLMQKARYRIINVSVQLLGQVPRIGNRRLETETKISEILQAPVSFSATTTDHLGFLGRKEGVAAIASALVYQMD